MLLWIWNMIGRTRDRNGKVEKPLTAKILWYSLFVTGILGSIFTAIGGTSEPSAFRLAVAHC